MNKITLQVGQIWIYRGGIYYPWIITGWDDKIYASGSLHHSDYIQSLFLSKNKNDEICLDSNRDWIFGGYICNLCGKQCNQQCWYVSNK